MPDNVILPGRLHYTTGNVEAAVQFFLKLLRGSSEPVDRAAMLGLTNGNIADGSKAMGSDKVFLEDFRVALQVIVLSIHHCDRP